jgi:DNA (cytosine-5)-methyltransferase 1
VSGAFYNENEPFAAEWLRNLVTAGHIASGSVDARSIAEVKPDDVRFASQAHFFAGIGVWSYALRCAGWPDDVSVWTGSCPCQPWSTAGRGKGFDDERHLWPAWFELIRECEPAVIFGEQVASPDGLRWFDAVSSDLEGAGYTIGAADLCAAGVGAPHIRQRLYFVAVSSEQRRQGLRLHLRERGPRSGMLEDARSGALGVVGDARRARPSLGPGPEERFGAIRYEGASPPTAGATRGAWRDAEWWLCRDGKARPAEPGTFPLADGAPARVGRLRAYGNAISLEVAAMFIQASMDVI